MGNTTPPRLPPPLRSTMGLSGALGLIFAWCARAAMVVIGALFVFAVLFWVVVAILFSLIAGWIRGRPSTVSLLWRQYRDLMRRRWPHTSGAHPSSTPRADATERTATDPGGVEDVPWRDVPGDDAHR